ncbi:lipase family protein [Jatrophihabitans sp. GAS493]|uniref:lipase family protein n=1 Tax=Jatrophihabitans sp. GAS493 TaxID=1907575 RepID=UPI0018D4E285
MYQYRGALEEVINTQTEDATAKAYCASGITTQYRNNYFSEHLTTDNGAIGDVVKFLTDRFNGVSASSSGC